MHRYKHSHNQDSGTCISPLKPYNVIRQLDILVFPRTELMHHDYYSQTLHSVDILVYDLICQGLVCWRGGGRGKGNESCRKSLIYLIITTDVPIVNGSMEACFSASADA